MLQLSRKFLFHQKCLLACLIAARTYPPPLNRSVSFSEHFYYLPSYSASKVNTFDTHIFWEIDTNLVTYPIDAHQRWRSTPALSHIPRGQTQVLCLLTYAYTLLTMRNTSNKGTQIIELFILIKNTDI